MKLLTIEIYEVPFSLTSYDKGIDCIVVVTTNVLFTSFNDGKGLYNGEGFISLN